PSRTRQKFETPSAHLQSPRPRTPVGTFEKSKDILDIDEIDLTGDVTTSSFGDFGPPTRLWRESSASRVEPVSKKKGKKRKSDEYQSDLFSPSSARSTSKRLNKATTYRSVGLFEGSEGRILEEHQGKEEDSPTQKPTRSTIREEIKEEEFPGIGFEEDADFFDAVDADIDRELMRTTLGDTHTRRARKVVPDSDEEDVDLEGTKILSQRPMKSESMENSQQDIGLSPKRSKPTQHTLQLSQPDNFLK
ncbi:ATP-dependent DNA helicase sgs1, partial [Exophiala xenobiotica]